MDLETFELVLLRRPDSAPDYPDEELERIQHGRAAGRGDHDVVLPARHDEPTRPRRNAALSAAPRPVTAAAPAP